jgi:thioredoxin 1
MLMNIIKNKSAFALLILLPAVLFLTCSTHEKKETGKETANPAVTTITSEEHFNTVVENAGTRLLVFDMYADWCKPCKMLSPIMEAIAATNTGKAAFYKIDVDKQQGLAQKFNVSSIPFVLYIKNKIVVESFTGLQPQDVYQQAIDKYSSAP